MILFYHRIDIPLERTTYSIENFCIIDPPSPPQIHGDLRAEQRSGDKVKLTCITDGGNPLPKLSWLRNGLLLEERTLLQGNLPLIFFHSKDTKAAYTTTISEDLFFLYDQSLTGSASQ